MAFDAFLIMKPNSGSPVFVSETLDAQFKIYPSLQITNFQFGGANPTSIQGAGKIGFNLLTFTKPTSVNSPKFLQYCAGGIPIARATLYLRQAGTTPMITEVYTFGTAYVMSYAHDGNNGDYDTETITINYAQFDHHYYNYINGVRQPAIFSNWNLATGAPWTTWSPLDGPFTS